MNPSLNSRPPPAPAGSVQLPALPGASQPADACPADRHAAVCAGAVRYLPEMRAFARALAANRHQADDLVQGAILRALAAAQQFTPGTNFKAWIFTILRNVFYNQCRSPWAQNVPLEESGVNDPVIGPNQERSLEFCDFRRAFAQLVPEQREALLLVGASGLGYEEAATVCGCAVGTVKSRVSRARDNLRTLMDGGAFELKRGDVPAVSGMDPALALQFSKPRPRQRLAAE